MFNDVISINHVVSTEAPSEEPPPPDVTAEAVSRVSLHITPATRLPSGAEDREYLLDALLVQSRDPILLVESASPDLTCLRLVYANPAFVQAGWGKALRGLTLLQSLTIFADALSAPALQAHVHATLAAGLPVRGEPLAGFQDGQPRFALMDIVLLKAEPFAVSRWLITLRDVTDQHRVEDALRQTQDRYRLITESMADVVSLHDPEGRFVYVTPSIFRLTGYTVEETLGCDPRSIVHPDDHGLVFRGEPAWEMLDATSYRMEWRRLRKDGSYCWLETTGTCIFDAAGALYRVVCCSRDISSRKQAEMVLREEQMLLRTLIDSLPDHIDVKDRQGRYLLDNETHARLLNLEPAQVLGKTVWDVFPHDLAAAYDADDREVLRTGTPLMNREEIVVDRDGQRRWASTTKTPLLGADGKVAGLVGISRDITDLKEAAEALQQSADKYRLLFQSNPQPMWVYDVKTLAFLAVNDTAIERYGWSCEEFLQMTLVDIRPPEDLPLFLENLTFSVEQTHVSSPWRHRRRDGSDFWVEVHSHAISFNDRAARLVVASDITERKRMEAVTEQLLAQTKQMLVKAVEQADNDPLTGLLNHRAFHKRLELEAARAEREGWPLAVAMMDLNNFKFFNDAYGHSVGDDVLRRVAAALKAACGPDDTLARFGGDEFALLMPQADAAAAERRIEALVAALGGVGYQPPGYHTVIPLTLSTGLAIFPDDGPGRLQALEAADTRLLRVKTGGTGTGELTEHLRRHLSCTLTDFTMLNALVTAVDAKDRYTSRHSEDVMAYSFQIAVELGLEESARNQILLAALLHDVGKIGVPDRILRKPGALTPEEFAALQQHPMMGAIIVGAVPGFEGTLDAIRHHHERWDGQGYPFGLCGTDIPLTARLMAVADAFSAMTTDRPYRTGMSAQTALTLLQAGAGSQWDPACVAAFVSLRQKQDGWLGL